jgi:hypothetical protein
MGNILITPNTSGGNPSIMFSGSTSAVTLYVLNDGTIVFSGSSFGDLLTISDSANSVYTPYFNSSVLSGGTILSGSNNIQNLFVGSGITSGGGNSVFINKTNNNLLFKSFSGINISISDDGGLLTFSAGTGGVGSSTNIQDGLNTYTGGTSSNPTVNISGGTLSFLSAGTLSGGTILSAGTNIGAIFITTAQTISSGTSIFIQKSGSTLQFKSLTGLGTTTITESGNLITINSVGTPIPTGAYVWQYSQVGNTSAVLGQANTGYINGDYSVVGGYRNVISGISNFSTIIGGQTNKIEKNSTQSFIGAGGGNVIREHSTSSSISSGSNNKISGYFWLYNSNPYNSYNNFIGAGTNNIIALSYSSVIGGGVGNSIGRYFSPGYLGITPPYGTSNYCAIVAGVSNGIGTSRYGFIGAGNANLINNSYLSSIVGGRGNEIRSSTDPFLFSYNSILGGSYNEIINNSRLNSILAGSTNLINTSTGSTIVAGSNNTITAVINSAIIGGSGYTLTTSNTVLVPKLLIKSLTNSPALSTIFLKTDSTGEVFQSTLSAGTGIAIIHQLSSTTITYTGATSSGGATVNNGINTFTAGTATFQSVNVTGLTIDNLIVTGATAAQFDNGIFIQVGDIVADNNSLYITNGVIDNSNGTISTMDLNVSGLLDAQTATTKYLKINTASASTTNPERIIAYDVQPSSYSNVFVGIASALTYSQLNIRNIHNGTQASSDIVATANNGTESVNYIDMGINSSTFTGYVGSANDGYLYSTGNDLWIGNTTSNKSIKLFTDGTGSTNVRVNITSASTTINNLSAGTITGGTYFSGSTPLANVFGNDIASYRKAGTTSFERWYGMNSVGLATSTTLAHATNTYFFIPFVVSRQITLDRIGINVTTTGGTNSLLRLGIYDSTNLIPNSLVLDAGTIDSASSTGMKSININQSLSPGLYYLTSVSTGATTVSVTAFAITNGIPIFGISSGGTGAAATWLSSTSSIFSALTSNVSAFTYTLNAATYPATLVRLS